MSYISAEEILPKELIETIQQYVSGKSIYIPSKEKKNWGSETKIKQYYIERNQEICIKHKDGVSVKILADEYSLSIKSIQRIIRTSNKKDSSIS
jgi:Mor family transcriptional regulator